MLVGGFGEINFGKQYRQGNRVYDSNAIAMCLNAQPVGNMGGYSYLYLVDEPICVAMRGRYNEDGKIEQRLEPRFDGVTNTITTVQKDNLVVTYSPYVNKKYQEFYDKNGYIPEMFNPYNCSEITDYAPTLTTQGDSITKSGTVLIIDD